MQRSRIEFVEPSVSEFLSLLAPQQGGGGNPLIYTSAHHRQRGFGLGSILRSLASTLLPFAKTKLLPSLAEAGGKFASGLIDDIGKVSFRQSLKSRGKSAGLSTLRGVKRRMQSGGARSRKRRRSRIKPVPRSNRKSSATKRRVVRKRKSVRRRKRTRKDVLGG